MIHHGDCVEVMAGMPESSVDAIVCDPPYGLEFMGKEWDALSTKKWGNREELGKPTTFAKGLKLTGSGNPTDRLPSPQYSFTRGVQCEICGKWQGGKSSKLTCTCDSPRFVNRHRGNEMQEWHQRWATEALRVAKPGAYLLAFGGTRTYHRLAVAIEDAGWIIRDCLVWAYASGFPKSRALLKPAWEPIVMARKPGPLRELAIDACRIPSPDADLDAVQRQQAAPSVRFGNIGKPDHVQPIYSPLGRWPANVILTDPIFDGDVEGVVGGGETGPAGTAVLRNVGQSKHSMFREGREGTPAPDYGFGDSGTYSRFFLIPKAARSEREPVFGGLAETEREGKYGSIQDARPHTPEGYVYPRKPRVNGHPTVKPLDLMRHLVRLVTPTGGTCLDPFLGSGTTAIAAEMEGFAWIGIEREAEYVAIAEARLQGVQKGLGLDVAAPTPKMPKQTDDIGWNKLGGFHHYVERHAPEDDAA